MEGKRDGKKRSERKRERMKEREKERERMVGGGGKKGSSLLQPPLPQVSLT